MVELIAHGASPSGDTGCASCAVRGRAGICEWTTIEDARAFAEAAVDIPSDIKAAKI